MNIIKFMYKCHKIKRSLKERREDGGCTLGLCSEITGKIGSPARIWFGNEFRSESPYPERTFWLGDTWSNSGYKNRIEYLKKFKNRAISSGEYKKW